MSKHTCFVVMRVHGVTPDTDISNILWNWFCYHRAYSAIYQILFWKLTLFVVTIFLQICLFIYLPILYWIDWKLNFLLHIVERVALGVYFSILYETLHGHFLQEPFEYGLTELWRPPLWMQVYQCINIVCTYQLQCSINYSSKRLLSGEKKYTKSQFSLFYYAYFYKNSAS